MQFLKEAFFSEPNLEFFYESYRSCSRRDWQNFLSFSFLGIACKWLILEIMVQPE